MEITVRGLWTMIHGMGFGVLYLLACSGAIVEICATTRLQPKLRRARATKLSSAFTSLSWRCSHGSPFSPVRTSFIPGIAPFHLPGTVGFAGYPQWLLMSSPTTIGWHSLGMEWKEHVAWLTPISITMAAGVFIRYGRGIKNHLQLRNAVLCFVVVSFLAAGIAGFFGAMLSKNAPVRGGASIHLMQGGRP